MKKKKRKPSKAELRRRARQWKANNPWRYAFNYHKQNARRRLSWLPYDDRWTLTFEEFLAVWDQEPQKKQEKERSLKGGPASTWEIDRIRTREGYKAGNVRLVTKRVNVQLYHFYKRGELDEGDWLQVFKQSIEDAEKSLRELRDSCPF